MTTDAQLIAWIEGVALQDKHAMHSLYDASANRLMAVAIRVVGSRDQAEDVLQDSFLTIWRNASTYRASLSPPMAWMGMIVRSRGLDHLRRRASEASVDGQPIDDVFEQSLASDDALPIDLVQASEQATALHQCLRQMPTAQRALLTMAYFRDLSQSELAQRFALPLGTVKTWMRRGLEQLRICMNRFV
jgi:RNA polymerase sigma-70 factor (ECF subfamily)